MQSVRHALSAAAVAAVALGGLTACNGLDIAVLQTGARTTGTSPAAPSTAAAAAVAGPLSASPTAAPTSPLPTSTTAVPTTSPSGAIASTPADTSVAAQIVKLVNTQRSKAGCKKKVTLDSRLTAAAAGHARDMAANNFFSHTGKDGSSFVDRIKAAGYSAPRSENIAAGQSSVSSVMNAWMKSADHRANILDCSATQMGAASAKGGTYDTYWVQDFGRG